MKVIRREWFNVSRSDTFRVHPIGDVHLGNTACHEKQLRQRVQAIKDDPDAYWIGLGDYADFINMSDPRFSVDSLSDWVSRAHLGDLARAQRDRFLDIVRPIAPKCLGLIEGNHERTIQKHYERSIYSEIVSGVKEAGGFDADRDMAFGYSGWLMLHFFRSTKEKRARGERIRLYLHHGFVGGKLAGAKALNMQRVLWTHDCDLAIMGHSHNEMVQVEAVETVRGKRVLHEHRTGMYSGTYMNGASYAEQKGYFPVPVTQPWAILRPGAADRNERVRVVA